MKIVDFNTRLVNGYLELLNKLDTGSKLYLISKLTKSIKSDLKENKNSFEKAFGAWDKTEDAGVLLEELEVAETF